MSSGLISYLAKDLFAFRWSSFSDNMRFSRVDIYFFFLPKRPNTTVIVKQTTAAINIIYNTRESFQTIKIHRQNLIRKTENFSYGELCSCTLHFSVLHCSSFAWAFSGKAEKGFWFPVGDLRQISEALVSEGFFLKTPSECKDFPDLDQGSQVNLPRLTDSKYRKLFLAPSLTNQFDSPNYYLSANSIFITRCVQDGCLK